MLMFITLLNTIYYYLILTKISCDSSSSYKGPARVEPTFTRARANSNRYGSGIVCDLSPACEIVPAGSRHFREVKWCRGAAQQNKLKGTSSK